MTLNRLMPWLASSLLLASYGAIADVEFDVKGVDKELKSNINVYLDAIPQSERQLGFRLQARVNEEIQKALQALGYYHGQMSFKVIEQTAPTDAKIELTITAGEPVRIAKVDIRLQGDASKDPAFIELLKTAPKEGEILNQGQYDSIKSAIQSLAIRRGYFNAEYTESKLEIAPGRNQAFIILDFSSGQRFHYGEIVYQNSQIQQQRLESMLPFKSGDPYLVSELGEFNQDLSNTGWFSSVLVEAGLDHLKDGKVPILVKLDPADRNRFEVGVGYSSDTGPRFKLSWQKPWFNSRGHSLDTKFYISKPEQTLETALKIPLQNAQNEYYQVQLGAENVQNNDTNSFELSASVSRHWKYDYGWQRSLYIRTLYSNFTQGEVSNSSALVMPGINMSRVRSRGGAMPTWGDKQSLTFEFANDAVLSDLDLYRLIGRSSWIRSFRQDHRFITKFQAGAIFTDNFDAVPPSLRFFVGGDNSIRGYGYESISPRNAKGELEGGSYMATASLEYNYRIKGDWWLAAFTDVGDAWSSVDPIWHASAGLGVRWKSPVGPIRLDVAHGFQNTSDSFMIHFGLGPEL